MKVFTAILLMSLPLILQSCNSDDPKDQGSRIEKIEAFKADDIKISQMDEEDVVGFRNVDHEMDKVKELEVEIGRNELSEMDVAMEEVELNGSEMAMIEANSKDAELQDQYKPLPAKPNHTILDQLLIKYVSTDGKVDYKGLRSEKDRLDEYIIELAELGVQPNYTRNEKLAFWINMYNACTLQLICENYPVNSIKDINGGKPWDKKVINVDGSSYSLNEIENSIIRPQFSEPRIHFAVNCAAVSCPKLMNRAFFPEKLDQQLTQMTMSFLRNKAKNQINSIEARVSKIFEWYKEDFGDLNTFLNKYGPIQLNENAKVSFNDYDWSLNE